MNRYVVKKKGRAVPLRLAAAYYKTDNRCAHFFVLADPHPFTSINLDVVEFIEIVETG